jgi:predicted MFS family arabinose efflux permease
VLASGAGGLGLLLSVSGLGAVTGSMAIASMRPRRRGLIWLLSVAVLGIAQLAFSFSTVYGVSIVIAFFVGLGQAGFLSLGTVLLQASVEEAYRGRVLSLYLLQFGLMAVGTFGVSIVANAVGVRLAVGTAAVAMLAITLTLLLTRSRLASIH